MQQFAAAFNVVCALLVVASRWLHAVQDPGDGQPAAVERVTVDLSGVAPPLVEGRPCWPPMTVAAWIGAARAVGIEAVDRTYDRIDSCRDADPDYGGTVQVGQELLDLYVDQQCMLRVAPQGRYLY